MQFALELRYACDELVSVPITLTKPITNTSWVLTEPFKKELDQVFEDFVFGRKRHHFDQRL
jgi:hypothetical protein